MKEETEHEIGNAIGGIQAEIIFLRRSANWMCASVSLMSNHLRRLEDALKSENRKKESENAD